jgi:hypothetical protein
MYLEKMILGETLHGLICICTSIHITVRHTQTNDGTLARLLGVFISPHNKIKIGHVKQEKSHLAVSLNKLKIVRKACLFQQAKCDHRTENCDKNKFRSTLTTNNSNRILKI